MNKYIFDIHKYNFHGMLKQLFEVNDLELVHKNLNQLYAAADGVSGLGNDTHSNYHKTFYAALNSGWDEFENAYKLFVKEEVFPKFCDETSLIFQSLPSFRIQYPNAKAVTTIHCDSDKHHKHPIGELNILIPLTKMINTSTVWMESLPNLGDFSPVNLSYGEWILWNGNRCRHYNQTNLEKHTRISMDLRVLPQACYNPKYSKQTATTKQKFVIGEYYSIMEK
jgi:hypothetical protein